MWMPLRLPDGMCRFESADRKSHHPHLMTGIIFATEEEARPFLRSYRRGRFEGLTEGDALQDDLILVSLTGSGKIKATLRTERLLQRYEIDRVLHAGTCTALSEAHQIGQLVAASQVLEGDRIELAAPTYPRMPLETPFQSLPHATLVTQDHNIRGDSERTYWQRIADLTDMSGYAVAYVSAMHGIPCHIVKVVSGQIGRDDHQLKRTLDQAHQAIADWLVREVDRLAA